MQEVLVCNLPVRSGGLSNARLDACIKQAGIKRTPDNSYLRTKRDKCLALCMAGANQCLKDVRASEAFKLLGVNKVAAAGRVNNSLTEVKHSLEDAQEKLLKAEPPVPCDASAARVAEEWHQALVDTQNRLAEIKRMHGKTLGLAQTVPDRQRLIAEMKANQYQIKTALIEVTEKLQQTQSTAEQLKSPAMEEQAGHMNRVREALGDEVSTIDGHIKEVKSADSSDVEESTTKDCQEVCAGAEQALSRTRAMLKAYTDRLPSVQDADRLIKMRDALEARAVSMKEVMRTADNTVDRVLNRLGALDGEVRGLDGVIDSPSKLAKLFRSIDALMVQHDEAVADAASAQTALKDAHSSLQSLQKDLAELVRMTGERVDASELADSAEMIAKLKRHISGSGGLAVALSSAQDTHTELASQEQAIEGRLATILQGLDKSLNVSAPQHGGGQESILRTIEQIEQRMAALIKERDRTQQEMQGMTTKFQSDMNLRTKEFNDRLTAMQQENERVLERVHDVVERMDANNRAMRGIAESIPNIDSQTIASVTNEQVSLLEDLREAEALLNHSTALQHKIAYEASTAATPIAIDIPPIGQQVPPELSVASLQRVHDDTRAAIGERDALVEKLAASVSRENEMKSQPDSQNLAEEVTALRGEIGAIEQKIADQETHIRVQSDIISKLPQEVKKLEDGDGAAKEKLVAIESGLWDRVSQKDAALEAIDHERNLQDSVDRETLRARTDAMIAENNDRLRQITTTLETLKREIDTGADPARIAALQDERERTRRAQELHLKFDTSLREHKADADVPVQTGLDAGSHLTQLMPSMSEIPPSLTPQDTFDQQRAVLERYQEEFAHQKQEIDRLSAQEAVNAQLHDQYNALKQQAETVSNQLIELLAPFGGNADALRSLVAEYAASNQRTRELTSENEQLREDLAATHRTMAEEYDRRIQQLQQELTEAQRREAAAKVDTLETRRRADDVAQDLKSMQDSTVALQGLPVLRFDEHHTISGEPAQAVRDIVKDYTFLRDDYGIVQGETRDRIVAILESLNDGSSVLDPDALPTHENESPEVLKRRLQVYQESVRATMSKQLEAKKQEAGLLALAYDATSEHDELLRNMRKIPAPAGSIQDIGQQLTLVEAFIREVTRGHAGQGPAPSGLDSITAEDLQHFKDNLVKINGAAELMTKIGTKALEDIQAAVTAFALQHGILGAQLAAVPDWQELQQQAGDRTRGLVRATLLDKIQAVNIATDGVEGFYARLRLGRDSLAPVQKMVQDASEMKELVLRQLSYPNRALAVDKLREEVDDAVAKLKQTAPQGKGADLDGMLGGGSTVESLSRSISQTYQDLISPVNAFITAWYSLVAGKPIPTDMLITPPSIPASTDPTTPAGVAQVVNGVLSTPAPTSPVDVSRLLAALVSVGWLNDHDFVGTERVTADKQPQILQKMQQYGRCMDAQRRAWGDRIDAREAIKCFYLGDILKRYDLLSMAQPTVSIEQGEAVVESLWPEKAQAGGAAVDWKSTDPYDVRKLNTLLISLNKIVMDRMKDLGEVSTLRADNEVFKVRYAALNEALNKKQDLTEKLIEITRQSIDRALSSEEILARDVSMMDDMKLFLLGKGPNDTFNSGRNVLKVIDPSLDWSGSVSDATEEVVSFRDKSKIRSWFRTVKKRITQDELHRALQSMVSCARFLVSSSAFTEEDDMLTEIHEIRRNLKEHLEALKAPYDDTFFDHIKDLKDINETWYKVLQDERQTRQLRDFENQILGVLTAQSSSKSPNSRRATEDILGAMLATVRDLQGLVTANPVCRTCVGDLEAVVKSGTESYRASEKRGADVNTDILKEIRNARSKLEAATRELITSPQTTDTAAQDDSGTDPSISWIKMIERMSEIPSENKTKIRNAGNRLMILIAILPIPDAVMAVVSGIDGPNCTWKEGTEKKLDDLKKECVSLYQQVQAENRSSVRKLWKAVEDMIVTRDFLQQKVQPLEAEDHDKKERELMWADLSGPQTAALTRSLQSVLQAMELTPGGARPQKGGGNLVETAADSLRTLFENVNAVVNLLKPGMLDTTPDSAPSDAIPFDPDRFMQRIAGLSDDEATEMVKKLKTLQESLRMQLLTDPSATQPTEAGILNLVLHQAIAYVELRQSCSQRVADLHKDFEEQMQAVEAKCANDISRADKEALQAKKALVDAESSDVPLSPSDIVYAFRSVPKPRAPTPEVRIPQPEATARVIDTQGKSDGAEASPIYETSPNMPSDVAPPPPLYTTTSQDMPPDVAPPPPLYSVVDTAQVMGPTESVTVHDPSETPLTALNLVSAPTEPDMQMVSSTHPDALPRGDQVHSPYTDSTDSNTTHLDEQTPTTHETQRSADILQEPVDSEATALLQPPTLDTASSIPQEPDATEQRPVGNQVPAVNQTGDMSERISSPSLVLSEPSQPDSDDRADVEDTRRPPEMMYPRLTTSESVADTPLPLRMNPLISAESPSGRSDRLPEASLVYPTLSEQLDAQAPDTGAAPTGYAPVTSPQPTAPASTFLAPARVVSPTQQGRKLEVVSDKDLADLRAFDWRSLATSVGTLVRHKLGEPGSVAPEPLPPSASGMTGGADTGSDWKRDLFSASLACYVMHAILMRTPEIIRMVSLTETDPDGKSDTFTQAILNHSGKDTALCRAFLDAVFVDVSAMRLPEDRVTSALHGFLSAIDRDSAIGSAQWLTLGEPKMAQRRCVKVDDFFKYSCLLLRALTESQSDRSENQDDMYRDALYVIGQVVRTRSEALSDPLNSLNLDAYRRVPTLNLGELKESHSRSGRAGVLT